MKACPWFALNSLKVALIEDMSDLGTAVAVNNGDNGMFFGCESLNRISFLRSDIEFIRATMNHSSTVFVVFVNGEAVLDKDKNSILLTHLKDDTKLDDAIRKLVPLMNTAGIRMVESGVNITFLGLMEPDKRSADVVSDNLFIHKDIYRGVPYYGIDIRPNSGTLIKPEDVEHLLKMETVKRMSVFEMNNAIASLYSHAKMYLNWLGKFKYCPDCGSALYPVDGGTKLKCSNPDLTQYCEVRDLPVNNVCFPRTDPVVIIAITTRDFSKICLARNKRRIGSNVMYSTIAGFMEPAETIEKACSREIWEETGVKCSEVSLVCSQPWPYPVNLMIGCYGIVDFNGDNEIINLNHDDEIMDARWFDTKDISEAIDNYSGKGFVDFSMDKITFPGSTAIAHHLIKLICDKFKRSQGSL